MGDDQHTKKIYLGLAPGSGFGWGVCSHYLTQELSRSIETETVAIGDTRQFSGPLFKALSNVNLDSDFPATGTQTYGYTFFENELCATSCKNAQQYHTVFAGSSWCLDRLRDKHINNSGLLLQGIDPTVFSPQSYEAQADRFTIFSGGKFELRKSQDLVIRAIAIMQQRHDDVYLIGAWHNPWPGTIDTMGFSPHISYNRSTDNQQQLYQRICAENGMDPSRTAILPSTPYQELPNIYRNTDVGLFPNRCEGGTNLVMMEYMACGRPVVATNGSGHKDIII
jgi:glycosyltransferase involved in cell wall biosynthesis